MRSYAIVSSTLAGVGYSHYESEPILGDLLLTPFHAKYDTRVCHNILVRIPPFVNCSELSLSVLILLVQMVKNVYPYKNGWRAEFRMFGKKVIGNPCKSREEAEIWAEKIREVSVTYQYDENLISNPNAFIRSKLQTAADCPENPNAANEKAGESGIWEQNRCADTYINSIFSPGHVIDSNITNGSQLIIGDTVNFTSPEHARQPFKSSNRFESRSPVGCTRSTDSDRDKGKVDDLGIREKNHSADSYINSIISTGHVLDTQLTKGSQLIIGDTFNLTSFEHAKPAPQPLNRCERRSSAGCASIPSKPCQRR